MDDATLHDYHTLLSWVGEQTTGLGALLRDVTSPTDALAAEARLADLPPATQRCLAAARRAWPRRRPGAAPVALRPTDRFLPIADARYPAALRDAPDPPPWLFCRGDPRHLQAPAVAVVGSRRASHAGLRAADAIARYLAASGYVVCSGLALGIDAAAHRAALASGVTVAVLASGLDRASPYRHRGLAGEIVERGCVVTELPFGTHPGKARFPRRNRIISGLCRATIVVEAGQPSGSLHTAAAALEQGRDVYTLPWSIFHGQGAGCLYLLRDGATPVTSLEDLPHLFPPLASAAATAFATPTANRAPARPRPTPAAGTGCQGMDAADLAPLARDILQLVGDDFLALEDLQRALPCSAPELLDTLASLELDGCLERVDGLYRRCV